MFDNDPPARRRSPRALWARYPYFVPTLTLIAFGWVLLLPGDTLATSRSFDGMARLASEDHWGWGLVAVGGLHLLATALPGRRAALAALGGVLFAHAFIALSLWQNGAAPTPGVAAYAAYASLGVWSFSHWDVTWQPR